MTVKATDVRLVKLLYEIDRKLYGFSDADLNRPADRSILIAMSLDRLSTGWREIVESEKKD